MRHPDYYVPWIRWEQVTITNAQKLQKTDPEEFRNNTDDNIVIDRIIIDPVSVTTAMVRFGKRGFSAHTMDFLDVLSMQNHDVSIDQGEFAIWHMSRLVRFPRRQTILVDLEDTVAGGARAINMVFHGYKEHNQDPYWICDRTTIPDNGTITAELPTNIDDAFILTDFGMYIEETGSAATQRGLRMKVSGGGLPSWSQDRVISSLMFPERNEASKSWKPNGPLVLSPGEGLEFEFRDDSGSDVTIYVGVLGFARDRRV